jgi:hypothetical protein
MGGGAGCCGISGVCGSFKGKFSAAKKGFFYRKMKNISVVTEHSSGKHKTLDNFSL